MASYDEEIRVAIIANAQGVEAGTAQAAAAVEGFEARVQASTQAAAAAYAESQRVWAAAAASAAQIAASAQEASTAQIIASYDALNTARDASLANAQAYMGALIATQRAGVEAEDYAAAAAASATFEQVGAEQAAATAAYENTAAQLEASGAIDTNVASTEADTAAELENAGAKTVNRGATIGLAQAIAGLSRGNMGMAAYGLTRMGASSSLLAAVMSPLGLAITGVTATIAGLGIAAVVGSVHQQELEGALLATGNAAGLTDGQLNQLASDLATGDTTVGDARDAILSLARAGVYSGQSFREAAAAAVDFASLTGESTAQASKYIASLANATTQSLIKANEQYHFLSLAEFTHIEDLRKEGKAAEATEAIIDAFYSHMHTGAEQAVKDEGYLARGWDDVKRAVSGALNAVEQWGAKKSYADQIKTLQDTLAAGGTVTDSGFIPYSKEYIAQINAQIAHLKALEAEKEKDAAADAARNAATDNAIQKKYGTGNAHHPRAAAMPHDHRESTRYVEDILREDDRLINGLEAAARKREQIEQEVNSINEGAARKHAQTMLQIHIDQLRTQEAAGQISHAQELAGEKKLYDDEYAAQLAEYQKELALEQGKPVQIARINAEIESLQDQHAQKMAKSAETAAQAQQKAFEKMVAPISQAFTTSINGIIQGTQTMQMAVGRMLDSILLKYVDVAIKSAVQWIASEAQKTMATMTGTATRTAVVTSAHATEKASAAALNLATIRADAAKAAAGAYSAVVGIPYVGPVLAPIAATTAFAAVGAYEALASFDVGAWNIPHDMPAMVHAGETILPRPFANDFRDAISGGGMGGGAEHHYHIHANDAASFHEMLQRNPEALAAGFRNAHRTGAFA